MEKEATNKANLDILDFYASSYWLIIVIILTNGHANWSKEVNKTW